VSKSVADFLESLAKFSLLAPEDFTRLSESLSDADREQDATPLSMRLVREKLLTDYQAAQVREGRVQELVYGTYLVLDQLGQGGMGSVFRAKNRNTGDIVALKVLHRSSFGEYEEFERVYRRFDREVQAAARLSHENIVASYDAQFLPDYCYLVMEYVDGSNLAQLVNAHGPLGVPDALNYLAQIASGLEHAHSKRMVHRDIKPENILVASDGTIKILDMGLVRFDNAPKLGQRPESADRDRLTRMEDTLGTVDYMSPEQSRDPRLADYPSDVYSLGCTFYFLLFGKSPFARGTAMATLMAHQFDPIPNLSATRSDIPPGLQAVFEKMVAKEFRERYQSMTDLLQALDRLYAQPAPAAKAAATAKVPAAPGSGTKLPTAAEASDLLKMKKGLSGVKELPNLPQRGEVRALPKPLPPAANPVPRIRAWSLGLCSAAGAMLGFVSWIADFPFAHSFLNVVGSIAPALASYPPIALSCYGLLAGAMVGFVVSEMLINNSSGKS